MRKIYSLLFLSLVSLFAATSAKADDLCSSAANIVANCGFESGDATGWTGTIVTNGDSQLLVDGSAPYSGDNAASFGSTSEESFLQTLTTVSGTTYTISFAVAQMFGDPDPAHGYTNNMSVSFGTSSLLTLTNVDQGDYTPYSYTATATGTSTDITFSSENDDAFWYVDSVSVTANAAPPPAVPEPSSLMLLGSGLAGFSGSIMRRLRRKA
jgi:hypothetical protein